MPKLPLHRNCILRLTTAMAMLLCEGACSAQAVHNEDGIHRTYHRTFIVKTKDLVFQREEGEPSEMVGKAIRISPYFELQFVDPVPRQKFSSGKICVFCAEVGSGARTQHAQPLRAAFLHMEQIDRPVLQPC